MAVNSIKMHADEIDTDAALVHRLIAAQFPHWARLPVAPVPSAGTDNALYRLGDRMVARLPRIHWAVGQVQKEQEWLPRLAPLLPLAVPAPLAMGHPAEAYPWRWSVYEWLEGETATLDRLADPRRASTAIAEFIAALRRIDPAGGPAPGAHNSFRGVPLARRDDAVRDAIASLQGTINADVVTRIWETALCAPEHSGPPVWIHGDLQSGNLLAVDREMSAVIDFGCLGVGDPACDLAVAWNLFTADARSVFRSSLQVGEAEWERGRGWALSIALIALPYYRKTNPTLAEIARRTIEEVCGE